MLEARAISGATPIFTSRGIPKRRELSPHNARCTQDAALVTRYLTPMNPLKISLP